LSLVQRDIHELQAPVSTNEMLWTEVSNRRNRLLFILLSVLPLPLFLLSPSAVFSMKSE
jgi:hypothetical protein